MKYKDRYDKYVIEIIVTAWKKKLPPVEITSTFLSSLKLIIKLNEEVNQCEISYCSKYNWAKPIH